ncbi:MAG: hypothetical protein KDA91_23945 [Planctomycetaceae bacterium]|nr:hypothetical protein [Planctomycetaceae bacterium]
MRWLRNLRMTPKPQHCVTSVPDPRIRATVPTSMLLGRILVSLWGSHWSSVTCNQARFAYGLDDGAFVIFPVVPTESAFLECCLIDLDESFAPISQVIYGNLNDTRLIGCEITDLLVPRDPTARFPDSQIVQMASGFGIVQESDAPIGILPSLYLTHGSVEGMISLFATTEWDHYQKNGKLA